MLRLPHWSSVAAILITLSGLTATLVMEWLGPEDRTEFGKVPDFTLTERSGRTVTRAELDGQIWVADFIFTRCAGNCPLMTEHMRLLQDTLPDGIRLVSFTVDPTHDTPAVLSAYAEDRGADPERWLFLTGERDSVYNLAREGFHLAVDDTTGTTVEPITHSSQFALVDSIGRIRNYYEGTSWESMRQLTEDLRGMLGQAQ